MTVIRNSNANKAVGIIKKEALPIIIFGAGIAGEVLFYACSQAGIIVDCFCDNNAHKTKLPLCGISVIHAPELKKKYQDAVFMISAADIKDVIEQLHALGYSKWYPGSLLLREFDVYQHPFNAPSDFVEYAVGTCILCHDSYLNPDKLFMRSVDIIITERCSLKCRDCSNLMQYYKNPVDCDINELLQSMDEFFAYVDEVNEFRVIGGEPLMNKEFDLAIKKLIGESKVKKIVIYTNGTIIPKEEKMECLKNHKILLIITDYEKLSKKTNELIRILQQNNIAFYAPKARGWTDCAKIMKHHRNIQQQKEVFSSCCARNTATLSESKLYRCPFSANANRLRAVPDYEEDYIDFSQKTSGAMGTYEMRKRIRAFLSKKKYLKACDYCNGRSFGDPEIMPAVQAGKPLQYDVHDR